MQAPDDTIAAIGTAPGTGGIAVVRVSGPRTMEIADRIVRCAAPRPSMRRTMSVIYGHIAAAAGDVDEVLVLVMKGPGSYTREDMIEIQGHGGRVMASAVLQTVLDAGARLAEPGEFTKRAFLNGRIDLTQAEAVADIVGARSRRAGRAALEQLEGSLSAAVNALYDRLMGIAADMEATLDFPEEDIPEALIQDVPDRISRAVSEMDRLMSSWEEGRLLREGALIVISGRTNVGKSTLLNALLDTDRAIVSHIPGTTRDIIEEGLVLDGIPVRLVDTAGLRETSCEIESEGIRRTMRHIARSDLQLHVLDSSHALGNEHDEQISGLDPSRTILVLNKTDLGVRICRDKLNGFTCVETSLLNRTGLEALKKEIRRALMRDIEMDAPPHAVISERHRQLLLKAREDALGAGSLFGQGDIALASSRLRESIEHVGLITGRVYQEDLLNAVFSKFCIGK
ncbi:MAG TPA: tRNA uridine-5-carboxymethylaminomethyl(34) synthesis GTPase MnmE [Kiritimatiellia bacterium]|nr:tRNA uridine-5-carboxymethylaminomethyl(34) synthesis GTPase MnmE [Kiritimatiellia bacterium]HQQ03760.1 tRNA uridine-5-carboxymethylaminomethyl(34) synthesis GTPase MnmE [Kiritimatiellia bacterium]